MQAHLATKPFINKPIENYKGLQIICGEDSATGHMPHLCILDLERNMLEAKIMTTTMMRHQSNLLIAMKIAMGIQHL